MQRRAAPWGRGTEATIFSKEIIESVHAERVGMKKKFPEPECTLNISRDVIDGAQRKMFKEKEGQKWISVPFACGEPRPVRGTKNRREGGHRSDSLGVLSEGPIEEGEGGRVTDQCLFQLDGGVARPPPWPFRGRAESVPALGL